MNRRQVLALAGTGITGLTAGCLSFSGESDESPQFERWLGEELVAPPATYVHGDGIETAALSTTGATPMKLADNDAVPTAFFNEFGRISLAAAELSLDAADVGLALTHSPTYAPYHEGPRPSTWWQILEGTVDWSALKSRIQTDFSVHTVLDTTEVIELDEPAVDSMRWIALHDDFVFSVIPADATSVTDAFAGVLALRNGEAARFVDIDETAESVFTRLGDPAVFSLIDVGPMTSETQAVGIELDGETAHRTVIRGYASEEAATSDYAEVVELVDSRSTWIDDSTESERRRREELYAVYHDYTVSQEGSLILIEGTLPTESLESVDLVAA